MQYLGKLSEVIRRQNNYDREESAAASCTAPSNSNQYTVSRRQNTNDREESAVASCTAPSSNSNQRTVSRLSGLLDHIRGQSKGKKKKTDKEHRIQVRWIHYNNESKVLEFESRAIVLILLHLW